MDIDIIKNLVKEKNIIWRDHVLVRMRQRSISILDILNCINSGEIIESYPNDYSYPSALVLGKTLKDKFLHIVCAEGQGKLWMITAYYPDKEEWYDDMKTRRR